MNRGSGGVGYNFVTFNSSLGELSVLNNLSSHICVILADFTNEF